MYIYICMYAWIYDQFQSTHIAQRVTSREIEPPNNFVMPQELYAWVAGGHRRHLICSCLAVPQTRNINVNVRRVPAMPPTGTCECRHRRPRNHNSNGANMHQRRSLGKHNSNGANMHQRRSPEETQQQRCKHAPTRESPAPSAGDG